MGDPDLLDQVEVIHPWNTETDHIVWVGGDKALCGYKPRRIWKRVEFGRGNHPCPICKKCFRALERILNHE